MTSTTFEPEALDVVAMNEADLGAATKPLQLPRRAVDGPGVNLYAAVLAGGSGTRFWPASTARVPKQFLPLTGRSAMIRVSVDRLLPIVPAERIAIVTSAATRDAVIRLLPEVPPENVLGEPRGRNTAAACALAARWAVRHAAARGTDPVLVTTPSDHLVEPLDELRDVLLSAAERAAGGPRLLTLGLRPTFAATGYGWIRLGRHVASVGGRDVHRVDRFVEKPDRARAEQFLASGGHLWNLGLFAWQPQVFLDALASHLPETAAALADADTPELLAAAYETIPSISVDHAVLEKHDVVECLPCSFRWDDLGSFAAAARHLPADAAGNTSIGPLLAVESKGCVAWAPEGGMTALLGVEDLIVVHAHGVTMVAPKARAEEVRKLVDALAPAGLERFR
ncbi:MAG: NTP transferase domain-containing protein [Planctomycetes bacterium]|nr:NTP transferase domain-containing protein [Planctomycetota bacterium]